MDLLIYICVGVWAVLTLALIIALGWLLDDRAHARQHAGRVIHWPASDTRPESREPVRASTRQNRDACQTP